MMSSNDSTDNLGSPLYSMMGFGTWIDASDTQTVIGAHNVWRRWPLSLTLPTPVI